MTDRLKNYGATATALIDALSHYLSQSHPDKMTRLENALFDITQTPSRKLLFKSFALIPQWVGSTSLNLAAEDQMALQALGCELDITHWRTDQLARFALLTTAEHCQAPTSFYADLDLLFRSADVNELILLYRGLSLFKCPADMTTRAREGARSNIIPVFLAIAHQNPFARNYFDEVGWNQLILKAVFNDCRLAPIIGLEQRNNPNLARMLCHYVNERWAAKRSVPWDIWRCIAPHADDNGLQLLATAINSADKQTRLAAALSLKNANSSAANQLLSTQAGLSQELKSVDWSALSTLGST